MKVPVSKSQIVRSFVLHSYQRYRYDTIYDTITSVYLMCSIKLAGKDMLSLPHGINQKLKCETKNEMMSVIGPVQSRYCEAVQYIKEIYGGKDLSKR